MVSLTRVRSDHVQQIGCVPHQASPFTPPLSLVDTPSPFGTSCRQDQGPRAIPSSYLAGVNTLAMNKRGKFSKNQRIVVRWGENMRFVALDRVALFGIDTTLASPLGARPSAPPVQRGRPFERKRGQKGRYRHSTPSRERGSRT